MNKKAQKIVTWVMLILMIGSVLLVCLLMQFKMQIRSLITY